jgi:hypothetical protein
MSAMQPLVFAELREATSTQDFLFALRFAGSVRISYQEADRPDQVQQFDQQFDALRNALPYDIPQDILRDYGLTESASPNPDGLMPQAPSAGSTGGAPGVAPTAPPQP